MEHFVTLFDYNFLPQGLSLIESIKKHNVRVWVFCLDKKIYKLLKKKKN